MRCPNCRVEIQREQAKFCPYCGAMLVEENGFPFPEAAGCTADAAPAREDEQGLYPAQEERPSPGAERAEEQNYPATKNETAAGEFSGPKKDTPSKARQKWALVVACSVLLLAGGLALAYEQGYVLDYDPPKVTIVSPKDGEVIAIRTEKPVQETVRISAQDNRHLKKVVLFLNGSLLKEFREGEPLVYRWLVSKEGRYTFRAYAYDTRNHEASAKATVIVRREEVPAEIPPVKVAARRFAKETESLKIDVRLPVIRGLQDKELEARINSELEKSASGRIAEIEGLAASDAGLTFEEGFSPQDELRGDFKVYYNSNGLFSIVIDYYTYTGGAHGSEELEAFNVDLKTGRELLIRDFYRDSEDWEAAVKRSIYNRMLANPENYFEEVVRTWQARTLKTDQPFYIADDNCIVVFFEEYELAPYAAGIPRFQVPVSRKPSEVRASGRSY